MLLSEAVCHARSQYELLRDGSFAVLEQCTKIRASEALTYIEKPKYIEYLKNQDISCVICLPGLEKDLPSNIKGVVVSTHPKAVFFEIQQYFAHEAPEVPTVIADDSQISKQAYIAPYNVTIGKNVVIEPFVCIYPGVTIEDNVTIAAGSVIGGQSYVTYDSSDGERHFVTDMGFVHIGKNVGILANCVVERGTLECDTTNIETFVKIDHHACIEHGVQLGEYSEVASGACIAGNCSVGKRVWIGPGAVISNRIEIGDNARVSLGAVVTKNVALGETVSGNFAVPHEKLLKHVKELARS